MEVVGRISGPPDEIGAWVAETNINKNPGKSMNQAACLGSFHLGL
jgi:hypothetical protein